MFLIYALVDPRTDERFYIGQSSIGLERPQQHMRATALREKTPKAAYVRSLLALGVEPRIEVLQTVDDPDEAIPPPLHCWTGDDVCALDAAEMWWIVHGRKHGWPLTNRTHGGDGLRGLVRTPEHSAKIAASHIGNQYAKGYRPTPEHRAKLSAARKTYLSENPDAAFARGAFAGRKHTEETKAKMRAAKLGKVSPLRGKKLSPEMRAKLSAAHKGIQAGPKNPNYGKRMSDEQRAKISATKRANPAVLSEEARARISERMRGENHPMFGRKHSQETKNKISSSKRRGNAD